MLHFSRTDTWLGENINFMIYCSLYCYIFIYFCYNIIRSVLKYVVHIISFSINAWRVFSFRTFFWDLLRTIKFSNVAVYNSALNTLNEPKFARLSQSRTKWMIEEASLLKTFIYLYKLKSTLFIVIIFYFRVVNVLWILARPFAHTYIHYIYTPPSVVM